jgi:hypothetical protein
VLKAVFKANQEFFEAGLHEFLSCRYEYQYYLIEAFQDVWKEKKLLNWGKVFEYCRELITSDDLWKPEAKREVGSGLCPRKDWISAAIASLIDSGVRVDETAFDSDYLPDAKSILKILLEKQAPSATGESPDPLTECINTTKGRILTTFFVYALRCCRVFEQHQQLTEKENFIAEEVIPILDSELKKTEEFAPPNYEFSAIAAEFLPNLLYLSKPWVESNFARIFPHEAGREKHWRYAIDGYSYVSTVYVLIYNLLNKNGDLKRALDEIHDEHRHVRERIIDNISVSYLRGQETLDRTDSLFKRLFDEWNESDIKHVIDLFWSHREVKFKNNEQGRIFDFWRRCYEKIKREGESQNAIILSDLNMLTTFIEMIDQEKKEWLLECAPYAEHNYHSTFFIEYLFRLVEVNPEEVGEVFLKMLENPASTRPLPTYKEEHIMGIVEKLFQTGNRQLAIDICDRYLRTGHEFLRPIYDRFSSSSS